MAKKWLKSTVVVQSTREGVEKPTKRSYPNVSETATDEQLLQFGNALSQLTGEDFSSAEITATNMLLNPTV